MDQFARTWPHKSTRWSLDLANLYCWHSVCSTVFCMKSAPSHDRDGLLDLFPARVAPCFCEHCLSHSRNILLQSHIFTPHRGTLVWLGLRTFLHVHCTGNKCGVCFGQLIYAAKLCINAQPESVCSKPTQWSSVLGSQVCKHGIAVQGVSVTLSFKV